MALTFPVPCDWTVALWYARVFILPNFSSRLCWFPFYFSIFLSAFTSSEVGF